MCILPNTDNLFGEGVSSPEDASGGCSRGEGHAPEHTPAPVSSFLPVFLGCSFLGCSSLSSLVYVRMLLRHFAILPIIIFVMHAFLPFLILGLILEFPDCFWSIHGCLPLCPAMFTEVAGVFTGTDGCSRMLSTTGPSLSLS